MAGIPSQYFVVLAQMVRESGHDLLSQVGLQEADVAMPDRWLDLTLFDEAVDQAYALTGNPALGLDFGQRLNISSHTALGYAVMNCETLEQAIGLFLRYYRIVALTVEIDFTVEGEQCFFTVVEKDEHRRQPGFTYESLFAALNGSISFLLQDRELPIWFDIASPAPTHADRYYELLGPGVRFGQAAHRLGCPVSLLRAPIHSANPALVKIYEAQCQELLAKIGQDASVTDKVYALLERCEGGFPSHDEAATLLAMSGRTLRRKLREEEASFQDLLDRVRKDRALTYLRETRLPLNSIAHLLGFNDASNFRRAFERWTGRKPLSFRR